MENIGLNGVLTITAFLKGKEVWKKSEHNLIVTSGYLALLSGLAGTANKYISKVQIGTNSAAPALTDATITNPVDLAITKNPSSSKLTITFSIGEMVGNNTTFSEFGLICSDGTLFARKTWPPFLKIQDLTIDGTWEINI